jgi:hypothetical protein
MNDAQRADPWAVDAEPDMSAFKPTPAPKPARETVREVSEANNFPSRDPQPRPTKPKKQQRRHVTGRNVQINIKAKQETVDRLVKVADRCSWVLGEALEHALAALDRELAKKGHKVD